MGEWRWRFFEFFSWVIWTCDAVCRRAPLLRGVPLLLQLQKMVIYRTKRWGAPGSMQLLAAVSRHSAAWRATAVPELPGPHLLTVCVVQEPAQVPAPANSSNAGNGNHHAGRHRQDEDEVRPTPCPLLSTTHCALGRRRRRVVAHTSRPLRCTNSVLGQLPLATTMAAAAAT